MRDNEPYKDAVELDIFDEGLEDADAPLPLPATSATAASGQHRQHPTTGMADYAKWQPRWMAGHTPRWREVLHEVFVLVRPRLTLRYVLFASVSAYVLYCAVRRSPLFASRLPKYTGRYEVGTIDVEAPLDEARSISGTMYKDGGMPAFELETVLFSIYYPAVSGAKGRGRHYWIPKPVSLKAEGYARFLHVNNFIVRPILSFALWAIAGGITIPAKVDVPLLGSADDKVDEEFPVMVFSHGFLSTRSEYSAYCGELASRGYVVAAIEHRDGSGPATEVYYEDQKPRRIFTMREGQLKSDPEMDTPELKRQQLAFRTAEIEETVRVLKKLNAGDGKAVYASNLRKEGADLHGWEDRLDLDNLLIGGHSYGATGALQALKDAPNSTTIPAKGGIVLDPGKSSGPLQGDISVPLLVVHSDSWSAKHSVFYGRPHFDTVRDLVRDTLGRVGASWFVTSIGTSHPSITDAPLIEPLLLSWTTGATIDVHEGLRQYVHVSDDFFHFVVTGKRRNLLTMNVTHEEYGKDGRSEEVLKGRTEEEKGLERYWQVHVAPDPELISI